MKHIFLVLILILSSNAFSQNLSKGFKYIDEKDYDKALKIFSKAVNNGKNVVVGKYGIAVVYTRNDYSKPNNKLAYKYLNDVDQVFSIFPKHTKKEYEETYGISMNNIDSLRNWILDTEFKIAKEKNNEGIINNYLDLYDGTSQAEKLEHYRDSLRYADVKKDGSFFAYRLFLNDYPDSKLKGEATIERNIIWKQMYNEAYRSLEFFSIKDFENKYPDYPYYDDSTTIYKELSKKASQLKLHYGYLKFTNDYYGEFIKKAAPFEMAYQALVVLLQPEIEANNKQNVLDTIEKYKPYFGNCPKIEALIELINKPESEVVTENVGKILNTPGYEYMPVLTGDDQTMYFCGEGREDNLSHKGEDIYVSYFKNNEWSKGYLIRELSSASKNEAPLAITPDGNTMLVFCNGDIFLSEKKISGWSKMEPIKEINTVKYWEADAVMSADGNTIIFSSDRHGNVGTYHPFSNLFHGDVVGNIDLYISLKTDDGWSDPINLGKNINTPYAERTPYLHPDMKTLYFSSDGYAGFGKMDVYKSTRLSDTSWTEWSEPENLGWEINSPKKEYGYKITTDGTKAYFTYFIDNHSDIYSVTLPKENRPEQVVIISGTVFNNEDQPIQADIVWEDLETGKKLGNLKSDPIDGQYIITIPFGKNYGFYVSKKGYFPLSDNVDLREVEDKFRIHKDFNLLKIEEIVEGDASIELKNVFFDFDKYSLKKQSFPELKRLAEFLNDQPNIKIEISGHTDNKGSKSYNKELSQNRADEVKNYMISLGCSENQMLTVGYGDEKPIADNSTEEGRQKNRRVEFKVVK